MLERYVGYRNVPLRSQNPDLLVRDGLLKQSEMVGWENSLCGLTCALMALDVFDGDVHTLSELLSSAKEIHAYDTKHGWIHNRLATILTKYEIGGDSQTVRNLSDIYKLLEKRNLVIASVGHDYDHASRSLFRNRRGHLILIIGMSVSDDNDYEIYINDPGSETAEARKNIVVDGKVFRSNFSGNIIALGKIQKTENI